MSRCIITRRAWPALPLFVLAACTAPTPPQPAPPVPVPAVTPAAPPASDDWRDWAESAGAWTYRSGSPSVAAFGMAGRAMLELRCEAGAIVLARAAVAAGPRTIVVTTSDGVRSLAAVDRAGFAIVALPPRDPFLDRMAFSRGRIVVAAAGTARLVLPAQAEIGRVVEDCRG